MSSPISPYTGTGVALITGSSQGIGKAIALRLAQDGFDIALNDIAAKIDQLKEVEKEIQDIGKRTVVVTADVSSEDEVQRMVETVAQVLGGLDVGFARYFLCSKVGPKIFSDGFSHIADDLWNLVSIDIWERTFAINARGTFFCYKYAAIQMIKQGRGGRIIGASSEAGKQGVKNMMAYCATKFAIRGMTQSVAWEMGKYGITVNAYAPGAVVTALAMQAADAHAKLDPSMSMTTWENVPSGRSGQPVDIAGIVSFIASKESSFITGQSINVNGGSYFD
ncbi:hypothetical protein VNI00_012207 [Paramarasmius palmivorus]|uniref:NAD(P)-binding protein n=1 Tax=Paramarasmius palmivorus TaxID=297713 RepID=A0AAW0C5S1_9AGAR